jgi:hypothetical protein
MQQSWPRLSASPVSMLKVTARQDLQLWGGGGENGDLKLRRDRSMTEGLGMCGTTMQMPWTYVWGARVARLPILPQSAPRRKTTSPHPHQREPRGRGSKRDRA